MGCSIDGAFFTVSPAFRILVLINERLRIFLMEVDLPQNSGSSPAFKSKGRYCLRISNVLCRDIKCFLLPSDADSSESRLSFHRRSFVRASGARSG